MAQARIYQPCRTATQQGSAKDRDWLLEYLQTKPRGHDPLMGWTSSADMRQQLRLTFATRDEAVAFAERNAIAYRGEEPERRKTPKKTYADNFRFDKVT